MDAETVATSVKNLDLTANPAPLGLLGFGMTTVLLNLHNAGLIALGSMILAMGIFYGGLAQVIAGIQEWKKNNTFGATAFTSYGMFWLSLVALLFLPKLGLADATTKEAMAGVSGRPLKRRHRLRQRRRRRRQPPRQPHDRQQQNEHADGLVPLIELKHAHLGQIRMFHRKTDADQG